MGGVVPVCTSRPDSPTHQLLVWHDAVWHDADDPAVRAVIFEPDAARRLREDGVVFAESCVESGPETPAPLPDNDGSAGHEVAVVRLDAEPLRIGIAAVSRAALSFFMSH